MEQIQKFDIKIAENFFLSVCEKLFSTELLTYKTQISAIISRCYNTCTAGATIRYQISENTPKIQRKDGYYTPEEILEVPGLEIGLGGNLYLLNGNIDQLEFTTFGEEIQFIGWE